MTVALDNHAFAQQARDFFNNIKEKYPVLKDDLRIHHWPDCDLIFGAVPEERKVNVLEKQTMTKINDSGFRLLNMCTGTRTTLQMIKEISEAEKMEIGEVADKMVKFLYMSEKFYHHITFSDTPVEKAIRFKETGSREYHMPIHFVLELTNRCNMSCKHCYRLSDDYEPFELTYEEATAIIDQMTGAGARYVEVTGGEFTLHKRWIDIIDYLYERAELMGLLSNGLALNEELIKRMEPYKDKMLWSISLDSYDPKFHDAFRGAQGSHEKICRNIKLLVKHGHLVRVSMSTNDENVDHVIPTMDFVHNELKAAHFGFTEVLPLGRGANVGPMKSVDEVKHQIDKMEEIRDYAERYPQFMIWYTEEELDMMRKTLSNCGAGWKTVTVGPDGEIRPCVMMEEGIIAQGNIKKQSIEDIMKNTFKFDFDTLRMPDKEDCGDCFNGPYCRYCYYRAILTNRERVNQGMDICEWAKKYNIEKFVKFEKSCGVNCGSKSCSL